MKKLISLGISIAILISAFVLLPKQKNEDVIAGDAGGKNAKIESLYELKNALMSLSGMDFGDIKSGTITYSYTNNVTTGESSYEGGEYMFDTNEGEYSYYRADKAVVGTTGSGFGYGSSDAFNDGSSFNDGAVNGGSITASPVDPDFEFNPGDYEEQIKDQYRDEIENEVNNSIGSVLDTLSIGLSTSSVNLTLYFDEGVMYYQLKGTCASRSGEGSNKKVLTFVYDIEIYSDTNDIYDPDDDILLVRFNFFDGYSNDSKISPVITADKLGIWYEMNDEGLIYMNAFLGDLGYMMQNILEAETCDEFDSDDSSSYSLKIDFSDKERPTCKSSLHMEDENFVHGYSMTANSDSTLTFSNLNNTKIEFDPDKVDVEKSSKFDWDFFADLLGFDAEEGGIY